MCLYCSKDGPSLKSLFVLFTGRMGLDGVVPGTAYTLMTAADSSFAVDLVQNLNLSSQFVSKALQALAEKDPKWSRIRHITAGKTHHAY